MSTVSLLFFTYYGDALTIPDHAFRAGLLVLQVLCRPTTPLPCELVYGFVKGIAGPLP